MIVFGWQMRGILLAAKLDECAQCGHLGPHIILRKTYWFSLFWLPVLPFWISHGLICPACGMWEPIPYSVVRTALRDGFLELPRTRPQFEAALAGSTQVSSSDWEALGIAPGAPAAEVQAAYRRLARISHPDAGGSEQTFSALSAAYRRVAASLDDEVPAPGRADLMRTLREVAVNPQRGFFDIYLKSWPVLATIVLVFAMVASSSDSAGGGTGRPIPAPQVSAPPHTCWVAGSTVRGCETASGGMLFGDRTGVRTTCYFREPLSASTEPTCDQQ